MSTLAKSVNVGALFLCSACGKAGINATEVAKEAPLSCSTLFAFSLVL